MRWSRSASDGGQRQPVRAFPAPQGAAANCPISRARILVAEDNAVNQEVATGILETLGCSVVTAPNGRAAFRRFSEEKFDLVLMDCEMPVMDGIEATRRIREIEAMIQGLPDGEGDQRRTPIIALTAHALNDVRDKCLAAGMDDFLVKPFDESAVGCNPVALAGARCRAAGAQATMDAADAGRRRGAQRTPLSTAQVIDGLRVLDRKGGPSRLGRAICRFTEIAPPIAAAIRKTCENSDAEALWQAAHSLKSSAGALGAEQLSQRCARNRNACPRHRASRRRGRSSKYWTMTWRRRSAACKP